MDKIWYSKSFEVGGHWVLWQGWKNRLTTQNRQKSNAQNKTIKYEATLKAGLGTLVSASALILVDAYYAWTLTPTKLVYTNTEELMPDI